MSSPSTSNDQNALALPTRLALERTRGAYERTMMAWVRTAMSLITFGFTVYKFFESDMAKTNFEVGIFGPRGFGLSLIVIGLLSLAVGKIEHRRDLNLLSKDYPGMPFSGTSLISTLVAILGALALIAVVLRI